MKLVLRNYSRWRWPSSRFRSFQNLQIFERMVRSQMIQQRPQLHNAAQLQSRPLLQNVVMVSLHISVIDGGMSGSFLCTPFVFGAKSEFNSSET